MSSTRSRSVSSARVLTLVAFTAWLASKHPRTKVGESCDMDSCPLAKFLTQMTGVPHLVDGDTFQAARLDEDGKVVRDGDGDIVYDVGRELPQWAQHFVSQVDGNNDCASVSAMRALRIAESNTLGRASRM